MGPLPDRPPCWTTMFVWSGKMDKLNTGFTLGPLHILNAATIVLPSCQEGEVETARLKQATTDPTKSYTLIQQVISQWFILSWHSSLLLYPTNFLYMWGLGREPGSQNSTAGPAIQTEWRFRDVFCLKSYAKSEILQPQRPPYHACFQWFKNTISGLYVVLVVCFSICTVSTLTGIWGLTLYILMPTAPSQP